MGGRVGPRAGLDDVEKSKILSPPGLELKLLGGPVGSQSLRYVGSRLLHPLFSKRNAIYRADWYSGYAPDLC
jgi:hypothetical protein